MDLLPERWPLLLAGDRAATSRIPVTAPFDGAPIAEVDSCDERHIDDALATAYALFRDRDGWSTVDRRVEILERAASIMVDQQELLALEAAREGGKPLLDSRVEVMRAIDGVRLCVEHIRAHHGEVIPVASTAAGRGRLAFTQREPIGVVVAVSAFNHPLNLIVHQVAAAVAAGCPVIVKPADDTPLSCLRFAAILHEAGLPRAWCQVAVPQSIAGRWRPVAWTSASVTTTSMWRVKRVRTRK